LDGLGVFERRELEFILTGVGAGDGEGIFFGAAALAEDGVLLRIGGEGHRDRRAQVGDVEAVVEEAEGFAGEGGGAAYAAVDFDVGTERDDGFGVHGGAFRG
jgi:hypothetical protein